MSVAPNLLSVLMPVYNTERYIAEALRSVFAQKWEPMEIIVINDGSTDRSAEIAAGFPGVRVVHQSNMGLCNARNRCLSEASGEWIAFLDADDRWLPEKTTHQMRAFEADPELDLVFAEIRQFYSPELGEEERARFKIAQEVMSGKLPGVMLARRRVFDRVGKFQEVIRLGDCLDWYARAKDLGVRELTLPEVLLERRIHTTNTGIRERNSRSDYLKVLKASMDRRRAK